MNNKTIFLHDHILTHGYDIFGICETWFCSDTADTHINALLPPGYSIHHVNRHNDERGGGVALVYKDSIPIKLCKHVFLTQFEYMKCSVELNKKNIDIFVVYRPPPSPTNGLTVSAFITEWSDFLPQHTLSKSDIVLLGDINFHLENSTQSNSRSFIQTLESNNLKQHTQGPTHYSGHTLDVVITRETSTLIRDVTVTDIGLCNDDGNLLNGHYAIIFTINQPLSGSSNKVVSFRSYKNINLDNLRSDIISSSTLTNINGTLEDLTTRYITGLRSILDVHAPLITRTVTTRSYAPWYTNHLGDSKRMRRQLERKWRNRGSDESHKEYRKQCCARTRQLEQAKTTYYSSRVSESEGDQKALFKIVDGLLSSQQLRRLPDCHNDDALAAKFGIFFDEKITNIRRNITRSGPAINPVYTQMKLHTMHPTTSDEISKLIKACPPKSCDLDPLPSWLLKECLHELLPLLTRIFNESLSSGIFPQHFKCAIIKPIFKHGKRDIDDLANYRPVSNLHFASKILEKLVVQRLEDHMRTNKLYDLTQSAYKTGYSTETALMKLNHDILSQMDLGKCTILAALDLSAAFDTIDHTIIIDRLKCSYGVGGTALQWFTSYLQQRTQCVHINGASSDARNIK